MAVYFVDFVNGLDANNGLGPDASAATNKPWKTIAKLLGAAGMASGDTAYLSPAGPFREVVTVAMTSATAETKIIGDPANVQGFKTSGGVAVAPGPVIWTGWTTNDTSAASATALLTPAARDFLTFQKIQMMSATTVVNAAAGSTNITFQDCLLFTPMTGAAANVNFTGTANVNSAWLFDRCIFIGGSHIHNLVIPTSASADYNCGYVVKNSLLLWPVNRGMVLFPTGAGAFKGGGGAMYNCTVFGGTGTVVGVSGANIASSGGNQTLAYNNIAHTSGTAFGATTLGQLVENYNLILAPTARSNVDVGANSQTAYAPLMHVGQELFFGMIQRPFGEPMKGSPLLGFGNDGSQTAYDLGNNPRPAGGASALAGIGARDRGDSWDKETSTVRTGSNALSITGPGYQDFDIPVDASATTVTCYLRQDTTYAGTSPKLIALANGEIGVTEQTDTLAVADDTWEQLSVSFTPTAKGIITIRLLSSDTNGGGQAFADDFGVA